LSQAATKDKNNSRVLDALQLIWPALPEKAIESHQFIKSVNIAESFRGQFFDSHYTL